MPRTHPPYPLEFREWRLSHLSTIGAFSFVTAATIR